MDNQNGKAKKQRCSTLIGTHDGIFHCDDVLACYLLKKLPEFKDSTILRTRDLKKLEDCDVVVDVGAVYNLETFRFDHHQSTFKHTMSTLKPNKAWSIKLSSAGLVYCHFGRRILAQILGVDENEAHLDVIFDKVYENFIIEIDAIDNGEEMFDGEPKYRIHTNISSRVSHLLPKWNEESSDEILLTQFYKAMELVGSEFEDVVNYYGKVWWTARSLVLKSIESRFKVDKSGEILDLSGHATGGIPWKEHLFMLEDEMKIEPKIKFVIFTDSKQKWRVQAVPKTPNSFILRIPICSEWCGLRDEELSLKSGIKDCTFVHASGFIGGNENRDGALMMAKKSLETAS